MTDEQLLQLGKIVAKQLETVGEWPAVLSFDLYDHRRRLVVTTLQNRLLNSGVDKDEKGNFVNSDEMKPGGMIDLWE